MNEEQLKEIAILAKELGFNPRTLTTGVTFEKFTRVDKGLPLNDTCYYLLLCEIQLWLLEERDVLMELNSTFSKMYGYIVYKGTSSYPFTNAQDLKNYKDALTEGILESLKLIKNESN